MTNFEMGFLTVGLSGQTTWGINTNKTHNNLKTKVESNTMVCCTVGSQFFGSTVLRCGRFPEETEQRENYHQSNQTSQTSKSTQLLKSILVEEINVPD
jgi:hypothetical protein